MTKTWFRPQLPRSHRLPSWPWPWTPSSPRIGQCGNRWARLSTWRWYPIQTESRRYWPNKQRLLRCRSQSCHSSFQSESREGLFLEHTRAMRSNASDALAICALACSSSRIVSVIRRCRFGLRGQLYVDLHLHQNPGMRSWYSCRRTLWPSRRG